jgi:hypothetical protein
LAVAHHLIELKYYLQIVRPYCVSDEVIAIYLKSFIINHKNGARKPHCVLEN